MNEDESHILNKDIYYRREVMNQPEKQLLKKTEKKSSERKREEK